MTAPVELREASRWYGPVIGLNQVSLEFEPGITGLLGPNGAGKSTLMNLIAGVLQPSLGEVLVHGLPTWSGPAARRLIGFSPATDGFYEEMTGREFVVSMARLAGLPARTARRRAEEALEMVGMAQLGGKRVAAGSKGMRQRIKLAQALAHDPAVIILDEPLTGIDPTGRAELMAVFRKLGAAGKTVLISTHILHEIEEITDRIVLMARGRVLAAGTVGSIRDLLDEHPLTLRLSASRARELAGDLIALEEVVGVAMENGGGDLIVKVKHPEAFFRRLPGVVLARGGEVDRVEPLDASAEAIFDYLVGAAGERAGRAGGRA